MARAQIFSYFCIEVGTIIYLNFRNTKKKEYLGDCLKKRFQKRKKFVKLF